MPMRRSSITKSSLILALSMASLPAWATTAVPLPEPDALALLAIGGVAGLVIALRNRKNKK